jgi:hypothetical protein
LQKYPCLYFEKKNYNFIFKNKDGDILKIIS